MQMFIASFRVLNYLPICEAMVLRSEYGIMAPKITINLKSTSQNGQMVSE